MDSGDTPPPDQPWRTTEPVWREMYPTPATWDDIQRRARHCPVLHWAVTMVDAGQASREEALTVVALWLSVERDRLRARETDRLMTERPRAIRLEMR